MRNKLLITTALVAVLSAANVNAKTIDTLPAPSSNISVFTDSHTGREVARSSASSYLTDDELILKNVYLQSMYGIDVGDTKNAGAANTKKLVITDGARLDVYGNNKGLDLNDGEFVIRNGEFHSDNSMVISGGKLTLNGGEFIADGVGSKITISGGEINIIASDSYLSGFGVEITEDNATGDLAESSWGPVEITGGTVNVSGKAGPDILNDNSTGNFLFGSEINISGGALNIQENSGIKVVKGFKTVENNDAHVEKGTINLTNAGVINLSGGLWSDVSGNGSLNFKTAGGLVDGDVSGSKLSFDTDHSLSKAISGTIGDLAALNVNKGTLNYDKATGKITDLKIKDGAGLDIGSKTVNATNVDFADNSTLKFTVAGKDDGSYGKIKADTINVSTTGTKLDLTLNSSVLGKDEAKDFTILDGSVTGDFATLSENSRYEFEKVGNGVYKITGKATASDVVTEAGGSANNAGTAAAWDSMSLSNPSGSTQGMVSNTLAELSNKTNTAAGQQAYVAALTALAPEVAPMVQQNQTETANQVFSAVGTRLSGGSVSTGEGMSSGDSIFKRGAMWVQGMFNKSKLDDTSKAKGFDADSNGIAFGAEKYLNDDVKAGIGYAYTNTDIDGFMRSTDVDTHTAIVYGEYKPSNWYVNGIATYGWSDYSEHKNVAGVGVKADYDAETFGVQAMTGYDMQVKGFGLTPEIGMRYVHISQDGYKDSANQKVSANDSDILTGVIGAKVNKSFELSNGMNIKPEARVAMTYDLMNDDTNSVVTLANGSAYSVNGEALDRFGMEFGAGVTAEVNDSVELSLGYEGKFREDYQDHTGLINAKYKF